MDLATLIGLIGAFSVVAVGIMLGSSITIFIDIPSVMITVIGTFLATMIAYRLKDMIGVVRVLKNAFFYKQKPAPEMAKMMIEMSIRARKEGLLALESVVGETKDPFLAKGVQLVVDGHEVDDVDKILSAEIDAISLRHKQGAELFTTLGTFAPALGLIGTLIGLVQMLQSMDDPSKIGPAMAVALITTFYGAIMANLIFHPLAGKLNLRSREEEQLKGMVLSGIIAISNGDNPRIVEQKLNSFLPPTQQVAMFGEGSD